MMVIGQDEEEVYPENSSNGGRGRGGTRSKAQRMRSRVEVSGLCSKVGVGKAVFDKKKLWCGACAAR